MGKRRVARALICLLVSLSVFFAYPQQAYAASWSNFSSANIKVVSYWSGVIDYTFLPDSSIPSGDFSATTRSSYLLSVQGSGYFKGSFQITMQTALVYVNQSEYNAQWILSDFGLIGDSVPGVSVTLAGDTFTSGEFDPYNTSLVTLQSRFIVTFDGTVKYSDWPMLDIFCDYTLSSRASGVVSVNSSAQSYTPISGNRLQNSATPDLSTDTQGLLSGVTSNNDVNTGKLLTQNQQIADSQMQHNQALVSGQMDQQQQIANAQASQSAQEHDDTINGYDSSGFNDSQTSLDDSMGEYESQQAVLIDDSYKSLNSYQDDNFNLTPVASYTTAIAAVSSIYSQLWVSFGKFNVVFVVTLSLGVVCLLLKMRSNR